MKTRLAGLFLSLWLAGCAVGPDYHRPTVDMPPDWGWKIAEPADDRIKPDWWTSFGDPVLNDLETRAGKANQQVLAALSRIDGARATARIAKSEFFPELSLDPSAKRYKTPPTVVPQNFTANTFTVPLDLSYEIDLWGRVRRSYEGAQARAQASVADYYNVLLSLRGEVAIQYFLLRQMDAQQEIFERVAALRQKEAELKEERFRGGLIAGSELDRARMQWKLAKSQAVEAARQREELQSGLALLCGEAAPSFRIPPATSLGAVPRIPVGLPASLLERRPDVARAERKMQAANADIGVAYAAYFPALSLTGDAGYSSFKAGSLLDWENRLFQIGPSATLPLLNGGRIAAGVSSARAAYQATCADYRQTVLAALRDVTDALDDLHHYEEQASLLREATTDAAATEDLSRRNFQGGVTNYLQVTEAEGGRLQARLEGVRAEAMERIASVRLFKALGGGFQSGS